MSGVELSDKELRQELLKYGEKVGPITQSTRSLYIKKLNKIRFSNESVSVTKDISINGSKRYASVKALRQTKIKPTQPQRKSFGFSSDESDNNDSKENSRLSMKHMSLRRKPHQRSFKQEGTKSLPPSPLKKPLHKSVSGLKHPSRVNRSHKSSPVATVTNGYSDDSDDDCTDASWAEIMAADVSTSPMGSPLDSPVRTTPRRPLRYNTSQSYTPANDSINLWKTNHKSKSVIPEVSANGGATVSDESSVRKRTLQKPHVLEQASETESNQMSCDNDEDVSENTGLLARLRSHFVRKPRVTVEISKSSNFGAIEQTPRPWHLHCSALLPIGTIVFFVVLGLLYVTLRSDEVVSTKSGLPDYSPKDETMHFVHQIHDQLSKLAGERLCNSQVTSDLMTVLELKSRIKAKQIDFLKALQLIREHPQWEINLFVDEEETKLDDESLTDVLFMSSNLPMLSAVCRFRRAIEKVLLRVGIVLGVGVAIWLVILYRQYKIRKQTEERQAMFVLVEKILDVIKSHHESSQKDETIRPFIPIIHARDIIIPPQERRRMHGAWDKAVHFLSASESRIRVENQRISGEDFLVWRWIQVTSPSKKQQPPGRVWQGEAFDTNRSINTPSFSPTPCLKIRNLFDPEVEKGDGWELQIRDSILEKCADNNEILDIQVEKNSNEGLVYLKCATCAGAGQAFRSLHGSWFDGRLVTVKFIKLTRYHSRYPHTAAQNTPLRPNPARRVSTFLPSTPAGPLTSTPMKS